MPTTLTKTIRKPKPTFLFGFELEGAYQDGQYNNLYSLLKSIYGKSVEVADDCSVDFDFPYNSVEIKTPPLPEQKAIEKFFLLTEKLVQFGFKTNRTCGLHVNVSEKKLFKHDLTSPVVKKFCWHFGHKFPVYTWRKAFKRQNNIYCEWTKDHQKYFKNKWYNINRMINDDNIDRGAIHLDKVNLNDAKYRRVEIRMAGNTNYHTNKELLVKYVNTIRERMYNAYNKAFET